MQVPLGTRPRAGDQAQRGEAGQDLANCFTRREHATCVPQAAMGVDAAAQCRTGKVVLALTAPGAWACSILGPLRDSAANGACGTICFASDNRHHPKSLRSPNPPALFDQDWQRLLRARGVGTPISLYTPTRLAALVDMGGMHCRSLWDGSLSRIGCRERISVAHFVAGIGCSFLQQIVS